MSASWTDIESALKNGTLEKLDRAALEELARVEPPPFQNPALFLRCEQAQRRIARCLLKIEREEKERIEVTRHHALENRLEQLKRPHWITILGAVAAIVACVIAWFAWKRPVIPISSQFNGPSVKSTILPHQTTVQPPPAKKPIISTTTLHSDTHSNQTVSTKPPK